MPFLSGVECTKRIRACEDGILPANASAHICAVTTCNGSEAASLYSQSGFNGLIPKPVRFQEMSDFIIPLSKEAFIAKDVVEMISPLQNGQFVYPPLPPSLLDNQRAFFNTTSSITSTPTSNKSPTRSDSPLRSPTLDEELLQLKKGHSTASSISNSENFAILLAAQTRASLRKDGAISTARTGTISGSTSPFLATHWRRKSRGSASSNEQPIIGKYDKEVFAAQIAQELQAATIYDSDEPSRIRSSSPSTRSDNSQVIVRAATTSNHRQRRPPCHHRLSSPAFMVDSSSNDSDSSASDDEDNQINDSRTSNGKVTNLASSTVVRPSIRPLSRRPDFKFRSRSSTTTCTSLGFSSQDGSSSQRSSDRSQSTLSIATTVEDGSEDRQLSSSPVSNSSHDQDETKQVDDDGEEGSDHYDLLAGKLIPRHGSTSTIDDDSSCSTPDEEEEASTHTLSFNGNGTISKHVKAKSSLTPTTSDLTQRLASLKGVFSNLG